MNSRGIHELWQVADGHSCFCAVAGRVPHAAEGWQRLSNPAVPWRSMQTDKKGCSPEEEPDGGEPTPIAAPQPSSFQVLYRHGSSPWAHHSAVASGMLPAYRPEHVCRHEDTVALPSSIRDFVSLTGTDYKFTDSGRIEASALLAPGGTSKYLLNGVDDDDSSGIRCARADLESCALLASSAVQCSSCPLMTGVRRGR